MESLERQDAPIALLRGRTRATVGTIRWRFKDKREIVRVDIVALKQYASAPFLTGTVRFTAPLDVPGLYDLSMGVAGSHANVGPVVRAKHVLAFLEDCVMEIEVHDDIGGGESLLRVDGLRRDQSRKARRILEDGSVEVDRTEIALNRDDRFTLTKLEPLTELQRTEAEAHLPPPEREDEGAEGDDQQDPVEFGVDDRSFDTRGPSLGDGQGLRAREQLPQRARASNDHGTTARRGTATTTGPTETIGGLGPLTAGPKAAAAATKTPAGTATRTANSGDPTAGTILTGRASLPMSTISVGPATNRSDGNVPGPCARAGRRPAAVASRSPTHRTNAGTPAGGSTGHRSRPQHRRSLAELPTLRWPGRRSGGRSRPGPRGARNGPPTGPRRHLSLGRARS